MSQLTTDEMDQINFLLTEISFQLLGNTFYDIFGQQSPSLSRLVSMKSTRKQPNYVENDCTMIKALDLEINKGRKEKRQRRKRRASTTDIQTNEINHKNNGVSLRVPVEKNEISRVGKITKRRYTCVEERPTDRRLNGAVLLPPPIIPAIFFTSKIAKPSLSAAIVQQRSLLKKSTSQKEQSELSEPRKMSKRAFEIAHLTELVEAEYKRMKITSEIDLQAYIRHIGFKNFHNEPNRYLDEFHKQQQKELSEISDVLIEFIKFIKTDKDNTDKMGDIANCILELKNSLACNIKRQSTSSTQYNKK